MAFYQYVRNMVINPDAKLHPDPAIGRGGTREIGLYWEGILDSILPNINRSHLGMLSRQLSGVGLPAHGP